MNTVYFIGIDIGTQGARVTLLDQQGQQVGAAIFGQHGRNTGKLGRDLFDGGIRSPGQRHGVGIDHIGLGGDYDGMDSGPVGMEDVSGYPRLFEELARRGYSQQDLEKIASRNMMRVLRAAEAYAANRRGDLPIETSVSG